MTSGEHPGDADSTAGAFVRMVQGLLLEWISIGVVLMAFVAIAAGCLEATGGIRALAVVVGVAGIVVALVGWRRHWSDPVMWGAMLVVGAAQVAAFVVAVTS